ncbi:hypothetical protein RHGRI_020615 [Rhododendron griersonianum]|uniref:Gibberellin regulated protein n=1 Tax=Rhododendron griersonianum TaxID=479676 RepID=A0AAV6JKB1_9ERIC|nr:hypothetical protein RHGRI_020615 [Rhododendron griersonianum]
MKVVFATLLLISLLSNSSFLEITTAYPAPSPSPAPVDSLEFVCVIKCNERCSKAGEHKRCMEYCKICCVDCDACVPSGTSGNKLECPCYANKLNSKGGPKCP